MKRGNIVRWTDIEGCKNLLFFSQLVNELLFDYSIPSNRISTLNSHYLCLDANNAIDGIEHHGVPEGTLKPIAEELYTELEKDPAFSKKNNPTDYFVKFQGDKYTKCTNIGDIGYHELKNSIDAINKLYFSDNKYYVKLKEKIILLIKNNNEGDLLELFRITKSLLTELMNQGYSLKYLYMVMDRLFWNPKTDISSPDQIDDFFEKFDFNEREYTIVFKVSKRKIYKFINYIDDLNFMDELPENIKLKSSQSFLNKKSDDSFLIIKINGLDPYSAAESAIELIEMNTSVYRLYDHGYRYNIRSAQCEVLDRDHLYKVAQRVRPVEHAKGLSTKQISEGMNVANHAITTIIVKRRNLQDFTAILGAIEYHAHSLDSRSEENQLLDLWSIFESVLDISNKHTSDRIVQICTYLVPLLKHRYIFSLFEQLSNDIKNYDLEWYNKIIINANDDNEAIKKVCKFVLLDENKEERELFLKKCDDFPLLKERINYYNQMLNNSKSIYSFVEKHANRVRWQIMRIYRNRNLIIHNGQKMPYLPLLIENLHSYVDDFINYTIHSMSEDNDVNSMCQELFIRECRWNNLFQRQSGNITSDQIDYILSM